MSGFRRENRSSRTPRRVHLFSHGAAIVHIETLESRRLLTSLVAVNVSGNTISLSDTIGWKQSTSDDVSVNYTSTQVTLTGNNGTMLKVGDQTLSTYTVNITGPATLKMNFAWGSNDVTVTGDGTAALASIDARLGIGRQDNSLSLTKVVANSVNVNGGWGDDTVKLSQTTINSDLNFNSLLRRNVIHDWTSLLPDRLQDRLSGLGLLVFRGGTSGDSLELQSTTVKGDVTDQVGQLIVNQSNINGDLRSVELGRNSTFTSTDSTYGGSVDVTMGRDATVTSAHSTFNGDVSIRTRKDGDVDLNGSVTGPNLFKGEVLFRGVPRHELTVTQQQGSVDPASTAFTLKYANLIKPTTTIANPTVVSQAAATVTPKVTGTYDSVRGPILQVIVNGRTYQLGTDPQLTSPSTGNWSLDLTGNPLTAQTTTVTAYSSDTAGNFATGTGTITSEQFIINQFLTANSLTATKTSTGLNYVIMTEGSGAIPTNGQTVTVNYSGYILNANGTQGTKFDSNTDPQFNHMTPFDFTLGTGEVIKGWDQAFVLLPVGTTARLFIPSALAYDTRGSGNLIPPNSILIFDVEVVSAA